MSNFSKKEYEKIIRNFKKERFNFINNFKSNDSKKIFLRHDVDFSLEYALEIAEINSKNNISATFFFMISNNFYNLASIYSKNLVNKISNLKQSISLHFDPEIYTNIHSGLKKELKIFENLFGKKLKIISIHRPRKFLDKGIKFKNINHTYEDKYFKHTKYISDSKGAFFYDDPRSSKILKSHLNIQLLIHPIWWIEKGNTATQKLNSFLLKKNYFLNNEIALNVKLYKNLS